MGYNAKNYTEQGGDVTHIGGKLIFEEGSSVEGLPSSFTPAENQTDSEATTVDALKEDFNGLLAKLKAAGIMTADDDTE
ncbi:MAG: Head fiber protein [Bacteroidales bacterium]|nr:Head fiber protein [Bacteroidales bacterium]